MKYIVYSKVNCPYCDKAEKLLANCGKDYEIIDVTNDPEGLEKIKNETGMKTVPQIFLESDIMQKEFIGGYTELKAKFDGLN